MGVGIGGIDFERSVGIGARLAKRCFAIVPPAEAGSHAMQEAQHGVEWRGGLVKRQRLFPIEPRAARVLFGDGLAEVGHSLGPVGPGLDIGGRRVAQPRLFALGQPDLHLGCQDEGDFVLDGENVVDGAVIAFRPEVRAVVGVDQLRRDPDAVAALANAALQNVSHTKLLRRLTDIDRRPL